MSYGITPFRVEFSTIEQLFGSGDTALQKVIQQAFSRRLHELDELFDDSPSANEILADYIAGEINYPDAGSLYWYIVEIMCEHFGIFLDNREWYPADDSVLWSMNSLSSHAIKALPYAMDFPVVRVAFNARLDELAKEAEEKISEPAMKTQFLSWVKQAKLAGQDVVLFYY